ncbi:MAG: hypothetical protein AAFX39_13670 [Pseudomonadota bacterium]
MDLVKGPVFAGVMLALATVPASASPCDLDVLIAFEEGAPRDRFSIENRSIGDWTVGAITIDLSASTGGLFFDTDAGGAGSQVFQPFVPLDAPDVRLRRITHLHDGGSRITLDFDEMPPGARFQFSLDVDDPNPVSPGGATQITKSEIEGALVRAVMRGPNGTLSAKEARFGDDAAAHIQPSWCAKLS